MYTDDLLAMSHKPEQILQPLRRVYKFKEFGKPTRYLGAEVGTYTAHGMNCWYLLAEEYLGHVIKSVEEQHVLPTAYTQCPYPPAYDPEINTTRELNDDEANYYQSFIGTLRWTIELGRLDIAVHVSKLSSHTVCPCEYLCLFEEAYPLKAGYEPNCDQLE